MSPDAPRRLELDGLRAIAVLGVVACHFALASRTGYFRSEIADVGSRGVELFFVLSGFCLAYPVLAASRTGSAATVALLPFLRRRIARIAPPYYVSLIVFGSLAFAPFGLPEAPSHPSVVDQLRELGFDALFLTNATPMHNPVYWTLGIEMRWYLLFPMLVALYGRSRLLFAAVAMGCYALYASPWSIADAGTLPCFMGGIVAADLAIRRVRWAAYSWPLAILLVAFAGAWERPTLFPDHGLIPWHLAFIAVVVAITNNRLLSRIFSFRPLVFIGVCSYSIYLMHEPLIDSLVDAGLTPLVAVLGALAASIVFWATVERPFLKRSVRGAIENALAGRQLRLISNGSV